MLCDRIVCSCDLRACSASVQHATSLTTRAECSSRRDLSVKQNIRSSLTGNSDWKTLAASFYGSKVGTNLCPCVCVCTCMHNLERCGGIKFMNAWWLSYLRCVRCWCAQCFRHYAPANLRTAATVNHATTQRELVYVLLCIPLFRISSHTHTLRCTCAAAPPNIYANLKQFRRFAVQRAAMRK